jgi:hypothetical protein
VIQSVSSVRTVIVPHLVRLRNGMGKISVPLKPSRSVHTHFKHITAIPVRMENEGIPVYKLRILDNLIERLVGQKNKAKDYIKISSHNIDTLITQFKQELSSRETSLNLFYKDVQPQMGMILNVFA